MSKTLIYTNIDDEEDDEVAGATGEAMESQPEESGVVIEASVQSGKLFCDVDNCPGQVFLPGVTRCLCEADILKLQRTKQQLILYKDLWGLIK